MNASPQKSRGYSADVRMHLSVNGHVFDIRQLGPDFLVLRDPVDYPATEGEITFSVDGRVKCWRVHLPEGVVASERKTRIADVPARTPSAGAAVV